MIIKLYISNNNFLYFYKNFIINLFTLLNIQYDFVDNYDIDVDFIISSKNDIYLTNKILYNKLIKNITIMNNIENNFQLMNKDLLINTDFSPYTFIIDFNHLSYDKNLMKKYINLYKYNKFFGDKYWILKNTRSGRGIGTVFVTTDELYNLNTNQRFIDELSNFKYDKNSYIIQKYLEKPIIYDNKKYDIRVHILLLTKFHNNKIIYKFYLYNDLIVRLTSINFDLNNTDKRSHLTNMAVQNQLNTFKLHDFVDNEIYDKIYNNIYKQVKEFLSSTKFTSILNKINKYPYCYDIFGLDILLDEDYNTYLIDYNTMPSLKSNIFLSDVLFPFENNYRNIDNMNMIECILFKIIKIYNKYKNFITKNNIDRYNKYKKIYNFKKYFKFVTKFNNNV